nr:LOW QUALITY PROTEIN: probable serine/threonine-protein kinase fhkE [Halyomorpha halys]
MIKVDESDPVGEMEPSFPYRDVTIKRGVEMKQFYDLEGEIGRGKFGTVYKCREKGTNLVLAAKFVGIARRQDRRNVEREVEIMRTLQHPRLIQLYDAFETDNVMCVVLELIEGGELFERVIDDDFILTEKACTVFMRQICEGVNFIHQNNIIHLDLKPENILCLTKTGNRIKIIDFGLARKYEPDKKLQVLFGTPEFVAPEVVNFDQISCATDMWSVGVICYVLLSGLSPFMGETDVETMANVTIARYDFDDESFEEISTDAKDFIGKLLLKEKEARLTAGECLSHPWLRRKIPPPPPLLESSKEKLKLYVDRPIPIIKNNIIIENDLNTNNRVSEKDVGNEQKIICSPLISSSLTSPKVPEHFESKKNNSQFVKSIQKQNFKENDNATNNVEDDGISNTHEHKTKNKIYLSPPLVKNPNISNQVPNNNIYTKNEIIASTRDFKKNQGDSNQISNHLSLMKVPVLEKAQLKNNLINNSGILEKNGSKNSSPKMDQSKENKLFDPKLLRTEVVKDNIDSNKSKVNAANSVGLPSLEDMQSTSALMVSNKKEVSIIKNIKQINEEPKIEPFLKRSEDNAISRNTCNFSAMSLNGSLTQNKKDNIKILLNNYSEEESIKTFDLTTVSDNVQRSSFRLMENENIPSLNLLESLKEETKIKEGEPLPFKQHLRSNPPWFSELNNTNLNSPLTDRNERRSSDFSCFPHSKDDSASLNLADEIRKLSARLLQMSNSQNQNVGNYSTSSSNPRTRNDPITSFLENHGISHPRPKYKFSNLNRDVPIGSPPPPSNIAYYLNMASSLDRNDSHSAPGSPRLSPDRRNIKTDADTSSHCVKTEHIRQISEGSTSLMTEKQNEQLNKTKTKSNFPI